MYQNKEVRMIFAQSLNGVIGIKGRLPWYSPDDMKAFRSLTTGCCVIMGRKTWDSLPEIIRPLQGRKNVVITRDKDFQAPKGVFTYDSLEAALEAAPEPIMIIGGGEIYKQAMPYADELYVSCMEVIIPTTDYENDEVTRAPEIIEEEFGIDTVLSYPSREIELKGKSLSDKPYIAPAFRLITYKRKRS